MNTQTAFSSKIRPGAFEIMYKVLRNPAVTGAEIDGQICRITSTNDIGLSLKPNYLLQYQDDELLSVRLLNNNSRQFIVLRSLLEPFDE